MNSKKKQIKYLENKNLDLQNKINTYEFALTQIYKLSTGNKFNNKDVTIKRIAELSGIIKRETNSTHQSKVGF